MPEPHTETPQTETPDAPLVAGLDDRPEVFDQLMDEVVQGQKVSEFKGKKGGKRKASEPEPKKAEPPMAGDEPEKPEGEVKAKEGEEKPPEPEAKKGEESKPKDAKGKSWEDEVKSRQEAETKMHTATTANKDLEKRLAELEKALEAERTGRTELEKQVQERTKEATRAEYEEILAESVRQMSEVDPDTDPKEYHRKVAKIQAEAIDKAVNLNLQVALKKEITRIREEILASVKTETEAVKKATEQEKVLDWVGKQANKAGLDMGEDSWDSKQFWRIFDHELPGDLTVQEGVAKAVEMVKTEKQQLLGAGADRAKKAGERQTEQTPMGRSGADRADTKPGDYQRRTFDDIIDEGLRGRKVRLRGG